jgi:hypothetical protein
MKGAGGSHSQTGVCIVTYVRGIATLGRGRAAFVTFE